MYFVVVVEESAFFRIQVVVLGPYNIKSSLHINTATTRNGPIRRITAEIKLIVWLTYPLKPLIIICAFTELVLYFYTYLNSQVDVRKYMKLRFIIIIIIISSSSISSGSGSSSSISIMFLFSYS
jgi:hypothetical protein